MSNPSIALPNLPKEKELEEYVSAHLQSSGLYVERNIIERGEEEVLELVYRVRNHVTYCAASGTLRLSHKL
jgi:hypothetical protein